MANSEQNPTIHRKYKNFSNNSYYYYNLNLNWILFFITYQYLKAIFNSTKNQHHYVQDNKMTNTIS